MRRWSFAVPAMGIGLALAVGSGGVSFPAAAIADDEAGIVAARSPLPEGTVHIVTASGDSGPGTFGDAVARLNADGGDATIEFAPELEVTLTQAVELSANVTIRGNGATVRWEPADPGSGSWISAEGVALQISGLAVAVVGEAWDPVITITDAPATFTTVLDAVTIRDSLSGGVHISSPQAGVEISDFSASGRAGIGDPGEAAIIEIWDSAGPVSVTGSTFSGLANAALAVMSAGVGVDEQVRIVDNTFSDISVEEAELPGMALTVDDVESAPGVRNAPAVLVADNTISDVSGTGQHVVDLGSILGGLTLRETTVARTEAENTTLRVADVNGRFGEAGADAGTLRMEGLALAGNRAPISVLALDDTDGPVHIADLQVHDSHVEEAVMTLANIAPDEPGVLPVLALSNAEVLRAGGPDELPGVGLSVSNVTGDIEFTDVVVRELIAEEAAAAISETNGSILVASSTFAENSARGLAIERSHHESDEQVRIVRSVFARNDVLSGDRGAGLSVEAWGGDSRPSPIIEVRDSSFLENRNGLASGAWLTTPAGGSAEAPTILIENSTFWNPGAGEDDRGTAASDLWAAPASPAANFATQLEIRNTTVERRDSATPVLPGIVGGTPEASALLDHVTMPGGSYAQDCSMGPISLRNSAIGAAESPAVAVEDGCMLTVESSTVPVRGSLPVGTSELPLSEWMLGDLSENGGPTLTLLPDVASPLVDSAMPSAVDEDQRGLARPQGVAPDRGAVELEQLPPTELGDVSMGPDVAVVAGKTAVIEVERSGDVSSAATAVVELRGGSAVAGTDFDALRETVSWAAGERTARELAVVTHRTVPGTRALTATVVETHGANVGVRATSTITISQATGPEKPGPEKPGPEKPGPVHPGTAGPDGLAGTGGPDLASALGAVGVLLAAAAALCAFVAVRARRRAE